MSEEQKHFAGLDIGGANIKFATLDGVATEVTFEIWKYPERLLEALRDIADPLHPGTKVAITMTAELADCFATKQEGVHFVVDAASQSFEAHEPLFYGTTGGLVESSVAKANWKLIAAANWHAIAWMAFRDNSIRSGFLIDIGSTTTDIIPVLTGSPVVSSQTDIDRLANGQLLYAAMERTPICSLLSNVSINNQTVSIAREFFATTGDALRWLGETECDSVNVPTADGRTTSKSDSGCRLARMVCADMSEIGEEGVSAIAAQSKNALVELLKSKIKQVVNANPELPLNFVLSGSGHALASEVLSSLYEEIQVSRYQTDPTKAQCAAAYAVALKRKEQAIGEADV